MPGINISTATRTGPTTTTVRESSQSFFVGKAFRGPTDAAVKINSVEEFELHFGGYVNGFYLHPVVESFFEESGSQCYVARAVGSGAAASELELLNDTTPVILLTAVGGGTWSSDNDSPDYLQAIVASGTASGTKVVKIYKGGKQIMSTGNCTSNQQICGKINTHPVASLLCLAEVLGGNDTTLLTDGPITLSEFTGGADDNPDDTELAAALDLFVDAYGTGAVICPETTGINDELVTHANTMNRLAFLYADSGMDPNDSGDYADLIDITQGIQGNDDAEHVAFFHPWIYVPTSTTGVNRLIPPVGYAAGARARAHNTVGPHQPGAGAISSARYVNGVEFSIGSTVANDLDSESINAIRVINNTIRVYGARSCSGDLPNFRYTTAQDVLNHVVVESYRGLEDILFSPIDSRNEMFVAVKQRLQSILEGLRSIGAIYEAFDTNGRRIDYGYTVKCDSSINPLSQLIDGTITARVGLRVTGIGDSIQVDIIKSSLSASVV
jgi:hypothetical protein